MTAGFQTVMLAILIQTLFSPQHHFGFESSCMLCVKLLCIKPL